MQNLAINFTVNAWEITLAFAGHRPLLPTAIPNDAVGSGSQSYESSSKPNTFTAIPPTTGQTFTVGTHGDPNATYDIGPDLHGNQGRSYGIGVYYTPTVPYYLNSESLGQPKLSWSDQGGQNNWVNQIGGLTSPPGPGSDVYLTNRTSAAASGSTIVNFDATTDPKLSSLTIDSNALSSLAYQVVELSQSANTLTSGAETIGTNGTAEHLQTGGVNNVTGALTINSSGIYDLQQGATLNASSITVNSGQFFFNGGAATFTNFTDNGRVESQSATGYEIIAGTATTSHFTQVSGSSNITGLLSIGNGANTSAVYSLQGGSVPPTTTQLVASNNEVIGNGGYMGSFQSGYSNNYIGAALGLVDNPNPGILTVSGAAFDTVISGVSVRTPTSYELEGGDLYTGEAGFEYIGGAGGPGYFEQTGGSNSTGTLWLNTNGTYRMSGGNLYTALNMYVMGSTIQNGNYSISKNGSFVMAGGTAMVEGDLVNSGEVTISGSGVTMSVAGNVTNSGTLLVQNGGVLDPALTTSTAGTFGGTGRIVGPVKVTGGVVVADNLHIKGAYTQSGGTITFDIDPDGKGGYLESDLLFDPSNSVSITGTKIVFDFLDGANPLAFFKSGAFNLDAFFEESDGSLFSSDFNLESLFAGDTFTTNMRGFNIAGFGADGTVDLVTTSGVPEPSTWAMLIVGFAGLGYAGWRRGRARVAAV